MNPITLTIIYFTIITGPIITMLSSNLFTMWVGLEMNLLALIPLMMNKSNPRSMEAATKYFLTQATASMILLMSIIMNFKQLGLWTFQPETKDIIMTTTFISLTIKLGLAPFHSWLPEVTQGIKPNVGLILLTWQKIAPLTILFQYYELMNPKMLIMSAITSVLIGAWNGLNQTQTRKIMAYSSIAHMGWMISILPYNPTLTTLNLLIYILMTTPMFMIFHTHSFTSISSMSLMWNKMPMALPMMSLILLSTGGLPPLTGFLPKWAIITELLKNNNMILSTLMAMTALINLFFYTRLIYSTSLTTFPTNNNSKMFIHQHHTKTNNILSPLMITSTMMLPLSPLLL
uniref:NADH-ubiquinone oxidoreductase chain 2 n=1 Tax=Dicrostonyx torquatus TaxID=85952 RepID=A0A1W5PP84_DICTO|nr:NADH dehydrogenase subunit 2 [Dicrostonyx torquatus]AOW70472.1 NADH dehydrogenase subunit 2 [Dicrostonyx torquatus]QHI39356.1 NADH dehydrogenase subunit 2 [Dicrostonyx torquatus]QHI39408.1 NADH dehydrogenase subunit 2 [Dicrostonyx torquatus]QHI39421.1 NADH dehydrogenase subunit 2 [Dicrostonyx torquatus]QHI39434.1 NADH dehydrogenase subunit 2 [Dicrostonyx torquatus]